MWQAGFTRSEEALGLHEYTLSKEWTIYKPSFSNRLRVIPTKITFTFAVGRSYTKYMQTCAGIFFWLKCLSYYVFETIQMQNAALHATTLVYCKEVIVDYDWLGTLETNLIGSELLHQLDIFLWRFVKTGHLVDEPI